MKYVGVGIHTFTLMFVGQTTPITTNLEGLNIHGHMKSTCQISSLLVQHVTGKCVTLVWVWLCVYFEGSIKSCSTGLLFLTNLTVSINILWVWLDALTVTGSYSYPCGHMEITYQISV